MAKRSVIVVLVSLVFCAASYAADNSSIIEIKVSNGIGDAKAINAASKKADGQQRTLLIPAGKWAISENLSVPSNINLKLERGAIFEIAKDVQFVIDGSFEPQGLYHIFNGEGKVVFGKTFTGEAFPQWWGDINSPDDTAICNAAANSGASYIRFPKGTYNIDPVAKGPKTDPNDDNQWYGGIDAASDTTLIFDAGAVLKAIPNDARVYSIIKINDKKNVKVCGAVLQGERDSHKGTTGEWGDGIVIRGSSSNIKISDVKVSSCWGDGIYIGEGCPDGVFVENSTFDRNRRNACSITNAKNILFNNCIFSNTQGTSPHAGVDVEPNKKGDIIQNVIFQNCRSYKNLTKGFSIAYLGKLDNPVSLSFINCISDSDGMGFATCSGPNGTAGSVSFINCTSLNAREAGFICFMTDIFVQINGMTIINSNQGNSGKLQEASSFVVWVYKDVKDTWAGNIYAKDVHISSTDGKALYAVYCGNDSENVNTGFKNISMEINTDMPKKKQLFMNKASFAGNCDIHVSNLNIGENENSAK